jgi:hypothetical protein
MEQKTSEKSKGKSQKILKTHQPQPLPKEAQAEIQKTSNTRKTTNVEITAPRNKPLERS